MKGGGRCGVRKNISAVFFGKFFLYVRSLTPDEVTAEEIAQETFVKALKSLNQFDGRKDIRAWLFTIAKNTYFSYCRRKKHDADWTEYENIVDVGVHFAENLVNEEKAFLIHKFLHNMEEPYKEVFNLRVFGELSYEKNRNIISKKFRLGESYFL